MLTDNAAAALDAEADIAFRARSGQTIAASVRMAGQINAAPRRRRLTQHQGRPRGRVDLAAMMGF